MQEPAGLGQSDIDSLTPRPVGTACLECVEGKQASARSSSPSPSLYVAIHLL